MKTKPSFTPWIITCSVVYILLKVICTILAPDALPGNRLPLILLSLLYLAVLTVLCHLCGKNKAATVIIITILTTETLLLTLATLTPANNLLHRLIYQIYPYIITPLYALIHLLRQLEYCTLPYTCQTYPDWAYLLVFTVINLLYITITVLSRLNAKTKDT